MEIFKGKTKLNEHIVNLCDSKPKPDLIKFVMAYWAIPNDCPMKKNSTFCKNPQMKLRLSDTAQKILSLLELYSRVNIRIKIEHDTGTSCFDAVNSFVKY